MTNIMDNNGRKKRAVVLLSGGLDSYTTAAVAKQDGYAIYAISFDYGQRHRYELEAAAKIAGSLGVEKHLIQKIDLRQIGGSALTASQTVPKGKDSDESVDSSQIPVTYVPARNTIFLSLALAFAEVVSAEVIYLGANAVDYSGYPDCRPEFIEAFETMANLGTKRGVEGDRIRIEAPLIDMTKAQIIQKGRELGLDYSISHSCYDPDVAGRACGLCDSCRLRRKGFVEAGVEDPTIYSTA